MLTLLIPRALKATLTLRGLHKSGSPPAGLYFLLYHKTDEVSNDEYLHFCLQEKTQGANTKYTGWKIYACLVCGFVSMQG